MAYNSDLTNMTFPENSNVANVTYIHVTRDDIIDYERVLLIHAWTQLLVFSFLLPQSFIVNTVIKMFVTFTISALETMLVALAFSFWLYSILTIGRFEDYKLTAYINSEEGGEVGPKNYDSIDCLY